MADKSFPNYCELTFAAEGGKLKAVLRPHCPGSSSGVTIGPGYDMKERTAADVKADLEAAGVPSDVATKLSGGVGKSGDTAKTWISSNFPGSDAVITAEASATLFTHVYPVYAELVRKKVSEEWEAPWDQLPIKMKELLVDLAFRGDMSRFKGYATKHEKLIKPKVVANDYAGFRALINDFKYWQDNTNLPDGTGGKPNGRITARGAWLDGPPPPAVSPVHMPVDLGAGSSVTEPIVEAWFKHNELEHKGGYFPIGANTVWHGGVHVHVKKGTPVRAMWDGKLVAARLSDDTGKAMRHYGSVNFVLLEHELPGATLNKMQPKGKLIGYKVRAEAIKLRSKPTTSGDKLGAFAVDDELDLLSPTLTNADGYQWANVKVKKAKDAALVGKTGYAAIKPEWYWALRESTAAKQLDASKTYKLYSLYMHLGCEPLADDNKALEAVAWPRVAGQASTDTLGNSVGKDCKNDAADVKKVQARLAAHDYYKGPQHGTHDSATASAIVEFQKLLVKQGVFKATDGQISPTGKTWKALQAAPSKKKLDAALVGKLRKGDVVLLDKPVKGGEQLWTSGEYGSSDYRAGLLHWELFSQDNLMPGWTAVEDSDDDFNLDCKAIVSLVDQDDGWWDSDEVLTLDEVVRFYSSSAKAKLLRKYACKFVSEWGINLDVAIPKMLNLSVYSTYGLKDRMAPYLWWSEAAGQKVPLPSSAKCWHYNPIAFCGELARVLPGQSEAPAATSTGDHVYVLRNGKKVPHYSQGDSQWGSRTLGSSASISAKGCAITSVCMILCYYGRDVNPKTMDEYLDANSGYSGDSVKWEVAFKCGETADLKFGARTVVTSGFKAVLDKRISENKPTLARVDYGSDTDGNYNHFVVIVGRHKDGHWIMNDPATSKGSGADDPSNDNLIEKTTRKSGYTLVQLDLVDPV
jgi:hypothetical protein